MNLQPREKKLLILLALVAVAGGIALYFIYQPKTPGEFSTNMQEEEEQPRTSSSRPLQSNNRGTISQNQRGGGGGGTPLITLNTFQLNRSVESCWVLLEGKVFDISNFLKTFPEYQTSALEFCGTVGFEVGFIQGDIALAETIKEYSTELGVLG